MSRDFNGTSALLSRSNGVTAAFPFSVSIWYRPTALTGTDKDLFSTHDNPAVSIAVRLTLSSFDSWKPVLYIYDGTYKGVIATSVSTTNSWQHAAIVVTSATNYSVFRNGGSKATGTTAVSLTPANLNRITLGRASFSASDYFTGQLAHCAVWNVALTDAEIEVLGAGLLPTKVRSASLTAYWSLSGKDSPEIDIVGRNDLTVTNATVSNEEPRIARALSSYLVALGGTNGTPITPEPAPAPAPPPAPPPSTPAIMNTRFTGLTWVEIADFSPNSKDYALSGVDPETGQVFSPTSPQIWGAQWQSPRLQLINNSTQNVPLDTAWTRAFTTDGLQLTRNIPYVGVPQCVYRIQPSAPFAQQGMVYVRGKFKLPAAMATNADGGLSLVEVKYNYTDKKLQLDLTREGGVWYLRCAVVGGEPGASPYLWGTGSTPNRTSTPTQDAFYTSPSGDLSIFFKRGVFADDPAGAPPDLTRWYTYEFAFRLQSPSGVVSGSAPSGWAWAATSVGTSGAPPVNGVGAQRFYIRGSNMFQEPNPGATIIFPFLNYGNLPVQGLPLTWRQVEVYDHWPNDASVHPADAL